MKTQQDMTSQSSCRRTQRRNSGWKLPAMVITLSLLASTGCKGLMPGIPDQESPGETVVADVPSPSSSPYPLPKVLEADPVKVCATRLLEHTGKVGQGSHKLPELYRKASHSQDEEFLQYMLSVIFVESRFNRDARSPKDAVGLMQITLPAVQDAVRHCRLRPQLSVDHLFDSTTNIRYGSCYLKKLLDDMDGDWTRTLITYNGGYKVLQQYDRGERINNETSNYVLQVERALRVICQRPPEA